MNAQVVAFRRDGKELPATILNLMDAGDWLGLARTLDEGFPIGVVCEGDVLLFERILGELEWQRPPYSSASVRAPRELLDAFVRQGLSPGPLYGHDTTAVALCAVYGQWDWMHALLDAGYAAETGGNGCYILHGLLHGRYERRIEDRDLGLLEAASGEAVGQGQVRGSRVNEDTPQEHEAVRLAVARLLVEGCDTEARALDEDSAEPTGWTPLMQAIWLLDRPVTQGFLQDIATPLLLTRHERCEGIGGTPLHLAILKGDTAIVRDILDALPPLALDPVLREEQARALHPLVFAARQGRSLLLPMLWRATPEPLRDELGGLALHTAAACGHLTTLISLRRLGADFAFRTQARGFTLLHQAAIHGQRQIIRFLRKCGMRWDTPNALGQTGAEILWDAHPDVARLMKAPQRESTSNVVLLRSRTSR